MTTRTVREEPKPAAVTRPVEPETKPAAQPVAQETASLDEDSTAVKAIALVASEAGLEVADLEDDATFPSLGIDSLMSLVVAEKFRDQLGVTVSGSLFLEYPTVGDLRSWLIEYYG